ncbi:MAG TPA: 4-oxalocrotonate tautomerase family protein [Solirubrobacterales bacterium]|jgi:4-oxalocrotonate tautomerase
MPIVNTKLFEGRLDAEKEPQLIAALTDAVVSVFGEDARDKTWVVLEEIPPSRWGFGGKQGRLD